MINMINGQIPLEYDYNVVGLDKDGSFISIAVHTKSLNEYPNAALQQAFTIADHASLSPYKIVYILSGDNKQIIQHIRGVHMTLDEITKALNA